MKKLCLFLAALFFAIIALAGPPRTITHSWNVADTFDKRDAVQWWKGESVTLTYTLTADGVAEDLTGLDLRWNVTERDVATNIYFSVTGTVTAATSGVVEFDLSSSQSRLSSDERYDGYIRVYNVSGGLVRVDVAQAVTANDSPYMGDYEPIGPLPSEEIDPAFTNWLAGAVFLAKDQNLADVADADAAWSNLNGVANGDLNWLRLDDIDVSLPGDLTVASNLVVGGVISSSNGISVGRAWITNVLAGSVEEGSGTTASGAYSHAEGEAATASGDNSHAEGVLTTASGDNSHAEGLLTTASGDNSHAEGRSVVASGYDSHAEGEAATASGDFSHAEGRGVVASGAFSHAEGFLTTASGDNSHAEGLLTTASGIASHGGGQLASATNDYTKVWSDGTAFGSTTQKQWSAHADNGFRFKGGPTELDGLANPYTATEQTAAIITASTGLIQAYTATNTCTINLTGFAAGSIYPKVIIKVYNPGNLTGGFTYDSTPITLLANPPASISTNVEAGSSATYEFIIDKADPTGTYIDGRTN